MILHRDDPAGKPAGVDVRRPARPFFPDTFAPIDDAGLDALEFVLIVGIGRHEWYSGQGAFPCNDTLARYCRFRADRTDKGHGAVRRLLKSLKGKGYIRVEKVTPSKANPTGRVLYLTPKVWGGMDPRPSQPSAVDETPYHAVWGSDVQSVLPGMGGPYSPVPPPRTGEYAKQTQESDPGTDSSSGDDDSSSPGGERIEEAVVPDGDLPDAALDRLAALAVEKFPEGSRMPRLIRKQLPEWISVVAGRGLIPAEVLAKAIEASAGRDVSHPISYIGKCVREGNGEPKRRTTPSTSRPAGEEVQRVRDLLSPGDSHHELLQAKWEQLTDDARREIEAAVASEGILRRHRALFHSNCLALMDDPDVFARQSIRPSPMMATA